MHRELQSTKTSSAQGWPRVELATGGWRLALSLVVVQACGGANVRPYYAPLPLAEVDTLRGDPPQIVDYLTEALRADSIQLHVVSTEEGYVESRKFDVRPLVEGSTRVPISAVIRLRFWIDPIGDGETQVTAEAVTERTVDPSLPQREREVVVPTGHAGLALLQRIREDLRNRFPR